MTSSEKEFLKQFGAQLQKIRKEKKLSLRKLSYNCKVDFSKIGQMEKGLINPTILTVLELSKGLDVHVTQLLQFH